MRVFSYLHTLLSPSQHLLQQHVTFHHIDTNPFTANTGQLIFGTHEPPGVLLLIEAIGVAKGEASSAHKLQQ